MVLIFVKKGLGVQVQCMLKISTVYILEEIVCKILGKKQRKIGNLICNHDLTNLRFGANLFFIKIYYAITACRTTTFTFGKC